MEQRFHAWNPVTIFFMRFCCEADKKIQNSSIFEQISQKDNCSLLTNSLHFSILYPTIAVTELCSITLDVSIYFPEECKLRLWKMTECQKPWSILFTVLNISWVSIILDFSLIKWPFKVYSGVQSIILALHWKFFVCRKCRCLFTITIQTQTLAQRVFWQS